MYLNVNQKVATFHPHCHPKLLRTWIAKKKKTPKGWSMGQIRNKALKPATPISKMSYPNIWKPLRP